MKTKVEYTLIQELQGFSYIELPELGNENKLTKTKCALSEE